MKVIRKKTPQGHDLLMASIPDRAPNYANSKSVKPGSNPVGGLGHMYRKGFVVKESKAKEFLNLLEEDDTDPETGHKRTPTGYPGETETDQLISFLKSYIVGRYSSRTTPSDDEFKELFRYGISSEGSRKWVGYYYDGYDGGFGSIDAETIALMMPGWGKTIPGENSVGPFKKFVNWIQNSDLRPEAYPFEDDRFFSDMGSDGKVTSTLSKLKLKEFPDTIKVYNGPTRDVYDKDQITFNLVKKESDKALYKSEEDQIELTVTK